MAVGRGYSDEAAAEGVEPATGNTQPLSTSRSGTWFHAEQLTGSRTRHFLGNSVFSTLYVVPLLAQLARSP